MTIVNDVLVVFTLLMICAFWLTADRKVTDDQEQEERDPLRCSGPDMCQQRRSRILAGDRR